MTSAVPRFEFWHDSSSKYAAPKPYQRRASSETFYQIQNLLTFHVFQCYKRKKTCQQLDDASRRQ